jgi:WD40 repeat protein
LPRGAIRRIVASRLWDQKPDEIACPADGSFLATTNGDEYIRLWDPVSGERLRRIGPQKSRIKGFALSHDGRLAASFNDEDEVLLWSITTGKQLRSIRSFEKPLGSLSFSPDGKLLAMKSERSISIRNVTDGKEFRRLLNRDGERFLRMAFSPNSKILATGLSSRGSEDTLVLYDIGGLRDIRRLRTDRDETFGIAWSPDGKTLAAVGSDGFVRLFDSETGKQRWRTTLAKSIRPFSINFAPDGKTMVCATGQEGIHLLSADTGKSLGQIAGSSKVWTSQTLFSPDGKVLLSLCHYSLHHNSATHCSFHRWDVAERKEILPDKGSDRISKQMTLTPDGKTLVMGSENGRILVWDVTSGKVVRRIETGAIEFYQGLVVAPDSKTLGVLQWNEIWLFDLSTGRRLRSLDRHRYMVQSVQFSSDGATLTAVSSGSTSEIDSTIETAEVVVTIWRPQTGEKVREFTIITQPTCGTFSFVVNLSQNGTFLICEERNRVLADTRGDTFIFSLPSGRLQTRIRTDGADLESGSCISHDGRNLAVSRRNGGVLLYEVATGQIRRRLRETSALAFSPDGKLLAVPGRLYDLESRKSHDVRSGASDPLLFGPDNQFVIVDEGDDSLLVWDLKEFVRKRRPLHLSDTELGALWTDLATPDAVRAGRAVGQLIRSPAKVVELLKARLVPDDGKVSKRIDQLLVNLDDDSFDVREAASKDLEALGTEARPSLLGMRDSTTSIEVRRRVQDLLDDPRSLYPTGEALRQTRAIEVLEHIGSAEARRLLKALAKGTERAPLTLDARAALRRVQARR